MARSIVLNTIHAIMKKLKESRVHILKKNRYTGFSRALDGIKVSSSVD